MSVIPADSPNGPLFGGEAHIRDSNSMSAGTFARYPMKRTKEGKTRTE